MDKESKEAIQTVFNNFDKDKSGFIDIKEIKLVSKELGEEISEEEVQRIFSDLDVNKDGKLSFDEFWDWWKFGRSNKLEKLVFFKLKAMNLLKKAHSEFVRMGTSLESKYDNKIDNHYMAVNLGESPCQTLFTARVYVRGEEQLAIYNELAKGFQIEKKDFLGFIIKFRSDNSEQAKQKFDQFYNETFKPSLIQSNPSLEEMMNQLKVDSKAVGQYVTIILDINIPMVQGLIVEQYQKKVDAVGNEFTIKAEVKLGLQNSLQYLMENMQQKFVMFLMKGFLAEMDLEINQGFLKNIRNFLLKTLQEKAQQTYSQQGQFFLKNIAPLFALLKGSKFHLVFRDVTDVKKFFANLGVDGLLEEQPNNEELLQEIKSDLVKKWNLPQLKQSFAEFFKLLDFFVENGDANGATISLVLPETLINMELNATGLAKITKFIIPGE